jgi:phage tail P2-like protein
MDLNNVSILNLMPPNLASDPKIKMAAEAFDDVLRDIIKKIPNISVIPNLVLNKTVDTVLIDLLAWQFHVDFYDPNMPVSVKRDLVLKSLDWHFRKGTPSVVEDIVSTVFAKAVVQEWFEYDGLPYRFRVATEESMPETETRSNLIRAINSVKNTRSYLDALTQLYDYGDEISIEEIVEIRVNTKLSDSFSNGLIKFNGRIKFDGKTLNDKVTAKGLFDGTYKFNGDLAFNGIGRTTPGYNPIPPFKFSFGIVDKMVMNIHGEATSDQSDLSEAVFIGMRKHHHFNGLYKFDGSIQFDSMMLIPLG